ncbi:autotransporter outer membrane beta-barrel domain-containing protein [Pontivivens ytuae]|uniref:Autotransporter outer membrane beta-barrel domain-containing protein n=1 Tax=Pontivivens ytuae TaxID=2789856 RepID=A0A7S9LR53_9RHOB|nr:autotransporter outer membrane beta-barrel domain-containing protein [Pontivivens ytuae]QPH53762.1 autotransporter outer membrane beta-barrel domain-containing protein [Pontivivens ytuae]
MFAGARQMCRAGLLLAAATGAAVAQDAAQHVSLSVAEVTGPSGIPISATVTLGMERRSSGPALERDEIALPATVQHRAEDGEVLRVAYTIASVEAFGDTGGNWVLTAADCANDTGQDTYTFTFDGDALVITGSEPQVPGAVLPAECALHVQEELPAAPAVILADDGSQLRSVTRIAVRHHRDAMRAEPGMSYINQRLSGRVRGAVRRPSMTSLLRFTPGRDPVCDGRSYGCEERMAPLSFSSSAMTVDIDGMVTDDLMKIEARRAAPFARGAGAAWFDLAARFSEYDYMKTDTTSMTLSTGVDGMIGGDMLVGVMAVFDHAATGGEAEVDGQSSGFLAGPYFASRLPHRAVLEGRVLHGQASGEVMSETSGSGHYDTDRMYAALELTAARISVGPFALMPSGQIDYQDTFTSGYETEGGSEVSASEDERLTGRVALRAEYRHPRHAGTPFLGFDMDFEENQTTSYESATGRMRAGYERRQGAGSFRMEADYGGIGDPQVVSYGGRLSFSMDF